MKCNFQEIHPMLNVQFRTVVILVGKGMQSLKGYIGAYTCNDKILFFELD